MSYCKTDGKDRVIFLSSEEYSRESRIQLSAPNDPPGLISENGGINWSCPCLGGMATGPCGVEFREAFSCFHYSEAEPRGSDCMEKFQLMQECMQQYPAVYESRDDNDQGTPTSTAQKTHPNSSPTTEHSNSIVPQS